MGNESKREKRVYALGNIEVRAGDDGRGTIAGYAAVFDQPSVLLYGEFRERIERGAFAASVAGDDVRALWNHNDDYPIGRVRNGTLRLSEDETGLAFEIQPPKTQIAADFVETIRQGYVDAMSFGFTVLKESWSKDDDGQVVRTLHKVKLYEVSPVTFPAYPQTSAEVRAMLALGDMPDIPQEIRRSTGGDDAERAQARLALMRRKLALMALET
jgi:HK97 family phage prohead protease